MRLKRAFLTSVVAAALAVTLGATAAQGASTNGKPGTDGKSAGSDQRLLAADVAADMGAPAVSAAVSRASSALHSRIVDFVQTHGTQYTFGSYVNPATGKAILETDAPADVVSSLVSTFGALVEVRQQAISDNFSRRDDVSPYWGGAGITLSAPRG